MTRRRLSALFVVLLAGTAISAVTLPAAAGSKGDVEWTMGPKGRTWAQIAAVCPTDGFTPCSGDLAGWIWGTEAQVRDIYDDFIPAMTASDSVSSQDIWIDASNLVNFFGETSYYSLTYFYQSYTTGWTASTRDGMPVEAQASWKYPIFNGEATIAAKPDGAVASRSAKRGVMPSSAAPSRASSLKPPMVSTHSRDRALPVTTSGTPSASAYSFSRVMAGMDSKPSPRSLGRFRMMASFFIIFQYLDMIPVLTNLGRA